VASSQLSFLADNFLFDSITSCRSNLW